MAKLVHTRNDHFTQALFFKLNTRGEKAFLDKLRELL